MFERRLVKRVEVENISLFKDFASRFALPTRRIKNSLWKSRGCFGIIISLWQCFLRAYTEVKEKARKDPQDLHLKVSKQLGMRLRTFVRLERCRSFRETVVYFLEAMLAVARRRSNFRLKPEAGTEVLEGEIRALVPPELYQALIDKSGEYGIKVTELVRVFLSMSLDFHKKLVPKNEVLRKEEFVELVTKQVEK